MVKKGWRVQVSAALILLGIVLFAGNQAGQVSAQAAGGQGSTGKPGPTAAGVKVNPHQLPTLSGETPEELRETPRLFPVDAATFGQMKAAANAAAQSAVKQGAGGSSSSPAPSFPGMDYKQTGGWNPPDGALAVGPNSVLVGLNEAWALYSRTGTVQLGPIFFKGFFGTSGSTFDPRALYDAGNAAVGGYSGGHGRFVLLATTMNSSTNSSSFTLAVSQNESPSSSKTGWCTYTLNAVTGTGSSAAWADFPGLGMDGDNLYITSNQFTFGGNSFQFARLLVIPKRSVYPDLSTGACGTAASTDYWNLTNPDGSLAFSVQPANEPDALPGQSPPMYLVNAIWASGSQLAVRTGAAPNSRAWATVAPYTLPANAPQPKGGTIDTGDTRLAGAIYRFGTIYTANTTAPAGGGLSTIQWYAISPGTTYTATSKAVSSGNVAYYFPGVIPGNGFTALEFSGSGSKQPASAYSMRDGGSPAFYALGVSGYRAGGRWGDYPGVSADPNSASTVWVLGEYAKYSSGWGTAINTP